MKTLLKDIFVIAPEGASFEWSIQVESTDHNAYVGFVGSDAISFYQGGSISYAGGSQVTLKFDYDDLDQGSESQQATITVSCQITSPDSTQNTLTKVVTVLWKEPSNPAVPFLMTNDMYGNVHVTSRDSKGVFSITFSNVSIWRGKDGEAPERWSNNPPSRDIYAGGENLYCLDNSWDGTDGFTNIWARPKAYMDPIDPWYTVITQDDLWSAMGMEPPVVGSGFAGLQPEFLVSKQDYYYLRVTVVYENSENNRVFFLHGDRGSNLTAIPTSVWNDLSYPAMRFGGPLQTCPYWLGLVESGVNLAYWDGSTIQQISLDIPNLSEWTLRVRIADSGKLYFSFVNSNTGNYELWTYEAGTFSQLVLPSNYSFVYTLLSSGLLVIRGTKDSEDGLSLLNPTTMEFTDLLLWVNRYTQVLSPEKKDAYQVRKTAEVDLRGSIDDVVELDDRALLIIEAGESV